MNFIVRHRSTSRFYPLRSGYVSDIDAAMFESAMRAAAKRDRWFSLRERNRDALLAMLARLSRACDPGWPTRAGSERWLAYGRAGREILARGLA